MSYYDPNDPTNRAEFDAYEEHEKHEPLAERAEDIGNREPAWVWALCTTAALAGLVALARVLSHC